VKIKEETATKIGHQAVKFGVKLSIHTPCYISLSADDEKLLLIRKNH
jgi:deoxyribonuclease-4